MAVRTVSSGWVCTSDGSVGVAPAEQVADGGAGGAQEAVVGHPPVVVELRQVAAAGVGDVHDDHRVGRAGRRPTCSAAATAVPPEPPMSRPSSRVTRRAVAKLTASLIGMTSSTTDGS